MSSATITTSARLMNSTPQTEEQAMVRKVAVSSFLGNFIEWFDYASYSYFATTIALVFFPTDNHTVAMLQTFGVFALSFVLRPIGALFDYVHVRCELPDRLPAVLLGDWRWRADSASTAAHGAGLLRLR